MPPGATTPADRLKHLLAVGYRDSSTVGKDLWLGPDLYHFEDGETIPQQANNVCKLLFLAGAAIGDSDGFTVEMGPWVGQSTRCLVAGQLAVGRKGKTVAFDAFEAKDLFKICKVKNSRCVKPFRGVKTANSSILPLWKEAVLSLDANVRYKKGPLPQTADPALWDALPIPLFVVDTAKSVQSFIDHTQPVWPYIKPGGIIVFMDFVKTDQLPMVFSEFLPSGELGLLHACATSSPWTFAVKKDLDFSKVLNFSPGLHTQSEWIQLQSFAEQELARMAAAFDGTEPTLTKHIRKHFRVLIAGAHPTFPPSSWFAAALVVGGVCFAVTQFVRTGGSTRPALPLFVRRDE